MLSAFILYILSYPAMRLTTQLVHHWYAHIGPLVLDAVTLNISSLVEDSSRTVSRRSEPSSRSALIDEQANPWEVLPPQDAESRHRCAKPPRRWELSEGISLLSPGYLLSVEL